MTEYVIEVGGLQFYASLTKGLVPYGHIDGDGVITVELGFTVGYSTLTFEDEVRLLEKDTRKVIFNSEDEQWERYR